MKKISVVIPTRNNIGVLLWALSEYTKQTLRPDYFEIIVSDDGSTDGTWDHLGDAKFPFSLSVIKNEHRGPAYARNRGADVAKNEIIVFAGTDTIPNRNMLFRHFLRHNEVHEECAIQGYTDWHPHIKDSFHAFLHGESGVGGMQAMWQSLKDKTTGAWIGPDHNLVGWFLTTNVSIPRRLFEWLGGFKEDFPDAAWEDICLALELAKFGHKTFFESEALNYHYHKQTLDGFAKRQVTEGKSRPILCSHHTYMAPQMLDPEGMRTTSADTFSKALALARELHHNEARELQEVRYGRWIEAFRQASLEGIRQGLRKKAEFNPIWGAIEHLHIGDALTQVTNTAVAFEKGDFQFAFTCSEWARRAEPAAWVIPAIQGEVVLGMGKRDEALNYFRTALTMGTGEKWPTKRIEELQS